MTTTYREASTRTGTAIPTHILKQLKADLQIEAAEFGRQGDVNFSCVEFHDDAQDENFRPLTDGTFSEAFAKFIKLNASTGIDISTNKLSSLGDGSGVGYQVVEGEADRNSHILNGVGTFYAGSTVDTTLDYGIFVVPKGETAVITHTAEHGSIAINPGTYRFWGQAEEAENYRRVTD